MVINIVVEIIVLLQPRLPSCMHSAVRPHEANLKQSTICHILGMPLHPHPSGDELLWHLIHAETLC